MSYKYKVNIWILHVNIHVHRTIQSIVCSTYITVMYFEFVCSLCIRLYCVQQSNSLGSETIAQPDCCSSGAAEPPPAAGEHGGGCVESQICAPPIDLVLLTTSKALMMW